MWIKIAHTIIRYRLWLMIFLALATAFMGYQARHLTLSYDYVEALPASDEDLIYYRAFKQQFGEDANLLAVGVGDTSLYQAESFTRFSYLNAEIEKLPGVKYVLSVANLPQLQKDAQRKKFTLAPIFPTIPEDQATLDSLLRRVQDQPLFSQQLLNPESGATLMLIAIEKDVLNSDKRQQLIADIQFLGDSFSEVTGIELHYAGIPFVRTVMNAKIRSELKVFLLLSVAITACLLLFFFRSWDTVVFPLIVIGIMVVWAMGTLGLLDYQITVLSGLLPPIIVVIGIPNCVYLMNKYHQEYKKYGNKIKALSGVLEKIGLATLITNVTTAIGFLVLMLTNVSILEEFGLVAGLNVLATFVVSLIVITTVFSYLPAPKPSQLKHLRFAAVDKALHLLDLLVHRHKYRVLVGALGAVLVFFAGMLKINAVAYLVDDVPSDSKLKTDLAFFEQNFTGVMPLEIVVDTRQKRSATRLATLEKLDTLERFLAAQPDISQPLSIAGVVKAGRQAFYNGSPAFYSLPNKQDQSFVFHYLKNSQDAASDTLATTSPNASANLLNNFADSTGQRVRVSLKIADIGSDRIKTLIQQTVLPKAREIFGEEALVSVTGASLLFTKGNEFLIENLLTSLLLAFGLIAGVMALLFGNLRMIFISLVPNIIPLIVTAGIMGYFGIPLKPSSAIIFSIVFGISVDDSIHFLAKYRQELKNNHFFVPLAISRSLRETGSSMIYTSTILFFGFIIFAGSSFGGTMYLGILTSLTLFIAMLTNLTVLPALLMVFDSGKSARQRRNLDFVPLIEHYDEFYQEEEDEEIDVNRLELPSQQKAVGR